MKKSSFFFVLCTLVLSGLFMLSCNDVIEYGEISQTTQHTHKQGESPVYSANMYDNFGAGHNENVDSIMNNLLLRYGHINNISREEVYGVVGSTLVKNGLFSSLEEFTTSIPISKLDEILNDANSFYTRYIDNLSNSSEMKVYIHDLFDMLKKYSNSIAEYSILKNEIIEIENRIMSSGDIKETEREQLLKMMSTARYSLYYWYNFENTTLLKSGRPWWKYLVVAGADILGGAGGGMGTAVSASALATTLVDWDEKTEDKPADTVTVNN